MNIKFKNYSMLTGKKYEDDWFEWCVFVDEEPKELSAIRSVEYTLHPTFPNPIRSVNDRLTRFALFASGWGDFSIRILIQFENSTTRLESYKLHLENDNWPKKAAPNHFSSNEEKMVYQALLHEKFRWRKLDTVTKASGLRPIIVKKALLGLQQRDLVRKASVLSIDGNELWGSTSVVGIAPKLE